MPIKVLSVFGTRPEAIKMAPLIQTLAGDPAFDSRVCVTGQHREMLDAVLAVFSIMPDWDLRIMRASQTLPYITAAVVEQLSEVLAECAPDLVLVHGDTTTSFAAALAGFYRQIPVGHVEAGLRSFCRFSPFPEEMNRSLTGRLASLHFAPTEESRQNLLRENITEGIYVTGNTVIDAMRHTIRDNYRFAERSLNVLDYVRHRTILLTAHRRENLGDPLGRICDSVRAIVETFPDVQVVFPVHKNPAVQRLVSDKLGAVARVHLLEPVSVLDLHNLMAKSFFVLTDSGGLQEEAPALHKPVLVLRTDTERHEVVRAGGALLVGTAREKIVSAAATLLTDAAVYQSMCDAVNPYGDGTAAVRIAEHIKQWMKDR